MQTNYTTPRLLLSELALDDAAFIRELLNTEGWIKFIGDRNIKSKEDAEAYIRKIMDNPAIHYRVVRMRNDQIPIGIVTFIKRDYLEYHDIGFAFLPLYSRQGFAYEATAAVLKSVITDPIHQYILATTLRENSSSIRLLEKLNFKFSKEIEAENEQLLVYALKADNKLHGTTIE